MRVGFIGVGVMGAPIARNILKGGFPLTVHDVDAAAADRLVAAGATRAESPRAVTTESDVVVTMVPDAPDVEAVALGPEGILAGARPGLIYIDMSTIDPLTTRRVGAAMAARSVRMIDCPVGRTTAHAEAGRLLLMLGGDPPDIEAVRPILVCTADTFIYCGPLGNGSATKVVNNYLALSIAAAAAESLTLGVRAGLSVEHMLDVFRATMAANAQVDQAMRPRRWSTTSRRASWCTWATRTFGSPLTWRGPSAWRLRSEARPSTPSVRRAGWDSSTRTSRASSASGKTKPGSASASRVDDAAATPAARAGAARRERARLRGGPPRGTLPRGLGGGRRRRRRGRPGRRRHVLRHGPALRPRAQRAPARRGAPRSAPRRFVLSTKVGRLLRPTRGDPQPDGLFANALPFDYVYDYSRDGARRSLEDSLQRLGLARIDIALIHDVIPRWHGAELRAPLPGIHGGRVPGARRAPDRRRRAGHRRRREGLGRVPSVSPSGRF